MPINFLKYSLTNEAFSAEPLAVLPSAAASSLALLTQLDLLENGSPSACMSWQSKQLINLMDHTRLHSSFWRKRLPNSILNASILAQLPILSRQDLALQIETEGSLVKPPEGKKPIRGKATSGSTGTALQVYVLPQNSHYNVHRSIYEYFRGGWPVNLNRTHIVMLDTSLFKDRKREIEVERDAKWLGPLSQVFENGSSKKIYFNQVSDAVLSELKKEPLGYVNCGSWQMQIILDCFTPDQLRDMGMYAWIQRGGARVESINNALMKAGIRTHTNYSCDEVGPIAQECYTCAGYYHVCHSNVIVEEDKTESASIEGQSLSRILLTHLHSYATPVIRYDVGDFAVFHNSCPCGHQGKSLSHIYGRGKYFVKFADGRLKEFHLTAAAAREIVSFNEWRFIQISHTEIILELSGVDNLTEQQRAQFDALVKARSGPEFILTIKCVYKIDWSDNPKRLFFISRVK